MKYRTDDLALLLSTDWFVRLWGDCGLLSPPKIAADMSAQCRKIVKDFVGDNSSYWDVEYSLSRMKETERQFLQAMDVAQLTAHDRETLFGLNQGRTSRPEAPGETPLIRNLLMLLVSSTGADDLREGITPAMFEKIHTALTNSADETRSDFILAASQSNTEWDTWVERITSEIPGLLVDVARDVYDYNGPAAALWGHLRGSMSNSEMALLVEWLNYWGEKIAGVLVISPEEGNPRA